MPINFFEKLLNVMNYDEIKSKIKVEGDIANYFKNKNALDYLSKFNTSSPQISEAGKKSIKMLLKCENPDYLIAGLRMRLDSSGKSFNTSSINVFSRVEKLARNKGVIWVEFPLCDVEILYGATHGVIEVEFLTDDMKNAPHRIYCVEIFVTPKKDFNYKEKLRHIEKEVELRTDSAKGVKSLLTNEQLIQKEL